MNQVSQPKPDLPLTVNCPATTPETNPFESLHSCIAFGARDWSLYDRDAWMYAIIVGWGPALSEVAAQHGWSPEDVTRLRLLRRKFRRAALKIRK